MCCIFKNIASFKEDDVQIIFNQITPFVGMTRLINLPKFVFDFFPQITLFESKSKINRCKLKRSFWRANIQTLKCRTRITKLISKWRFEELGNKHIFWQLCFKEILEEFELDICPKHIFRIYVEYNWVYF